MPSLRTIWRSALTRFLPTSLFLMMVGLVPVMLSGTPIHPRAPLIALSQVVASAVGFGLMLTAMRRRLADDTPLLGRPAFVAGVVAPIVNVLLLMVAFSPDKSRLRDVAVCAVGGAILGLAMFVPWMARERGVTDGSATADEHLGAGADPILTSNRPMSDSPAELLTTIARSHSP